MNIMCEKVLIVKIVTLLTICFMASNAKPLAFVVSDEDIFSVYSAFGKLTKMNIIDDDSDLGLPPVDIGKGEVLVPKKVILP